MTALTPGCDPDMSVTGAPFGAAAGGGPRVRSGLVLIAVVALSALLASADSVPGLVAVPAVVVAVLCAWAAFGTPPQAFQLVGLATILGGLALANRARTNSVA